MERLVTLNTPVRPRTADVLKDAARLVNAYPKMPVTVDCVIFGFKDDSLKVLLIRSDLEDFKGRWSLLGDVVDYNEELDAAAYRVLKQRTGVENIFLEQVKTFGGLTRHPGGRVITVAYCSLLNINDHQLKIADNELHWHNIKNLANIAFDHVKIIEECYKWLQFKIHEQPLCFNLLPERFSLRELQNVYEAILDTSLDRRNFRKKVFSTDFLIDVGEYEEDVHHRPGKLYRFDYKKYEQNKCKWFKC